MRARTYFLLIFALTGFAVAQSIYNLLLGSPEFLIARQNTQSDIWLLVIFLTGLLPLMLSVPGILLGKLGPAIGKVYFVGLSFFLLALFFAQLFHVQLGSSFESYLLFVLIPSAVCSWLLLFTSWWVLGPVLALLSLSFPLLFLLNTPQLGASEGLSFSESFIGTPANPSPPIIFVLADGLPLATLLDETGNIDRELFPNIYRLQQSSTWYKNTITVADGTLDAVPAIMTGLYPNPEPIPATIASLPLNIFTLLGDHYRFNVSESVTRLCPSALCQVDSVPAMQRFSALLLDLSALYLHRVVPEDYNHWLPVVTDNWSGFFAAKQEFFPDGWVAFAEGQARVNRPRQFKDFIASVENSEQPTLNFLHLLYPHVPYVHLPDGKNYGNHWLRGVKNEKWSDSRWGVLNGKQRHFLQVQHFDLLIGELLQRLHSLEVFDGSLIVLVADHGVAFRVNDKRRALSGTNNSDILRVPLIIKSPGQKTAQVSDAPVMTIDILPTIVGLLDFEHSSVEFDGIDLGSSSVLPMRERRALSFQNREFKHFKSQELDITESVAENRAQLVLSDTQQALWGIGPLARYRGLPLSELCADVTRQAKARFSKKNALPQTVDADYLPAFVAGIFPKDVLGEDPIPFVITQNDIIVASGETLNLKGYRHFNALVEPKYIEGEDWEPVPLPITPETCSTTVDGKHYPPVSEFRPASVAVD